MRIHKYKSLEQATFWELVYNFLILDFFENLFLVKLNVKKYWEWFNFDFFEECHYISQFFAQAIVTVFKFAVWGVFMILDFIAEILSVPIIWLIGFGRIIWFVKRR